MMKKSEVSILKPDLGAAALAFATGGHQKPPEAISSSKQGIDMGIDKKRVFGAPEGHKRLTINLPDDLHKKLKLVAIENDCTATDIILKLLKNQLEM